MVFSHNTPIYVLEFYLKLFYVALCKDDCFKIQPFAHFCNGSNETFAIYTAPPAGLVECKWNTLVVQLYWLIDKYFFNVAKIWVSNYSKAVAIVKVSVPFLFWVSIFMVLQVVHLPQNLLVHCGRKSFSKNCVEENLYDDRMQWLPHTEPLLMRTDFLLQTKASWWMAGCLLASPTPPPLFFNTWPNVSSPSYPPSLSTAKLRLCVGRRAAIATLAVWLRDHNRAVIQMVGGFSLI